MTIILQNMITGSDIAVAVFIYLSTLASSTLIILFSNKYFPSISLFMHEWNECLSTSLMDNSLGGGVYGFAEACFFSFSYPSDFGEFNKNIRKINQICNRERKFSQFLCQKVTKFH
jgi:hypothetical protein